MRDIDNRERERETTVGEPSGGVASTDPPLPLFLLSAGQLRQEGDQHWILSRRRQPVLVLDLAGALSGECCVGEIQPTGSGREAAFCRW